MNPQRVVMRVNSATLKVDGVKAVSVTPYVVGGLPGVTGRAWIVVPQAPKPVANTLAPVTVDALQVALFEASILVTMDVGTPGVRVLLIKSLRAESEFNP